MKLFHSLSFRLAMIYVALFAGSTALLVGVNYWVTIAQPLAVAQDEVRRDARTLSDAYIVDGRASLIAKLNRRAGTGATRRPFHAFIAPDGRTVSANLPSWPDSVTSGWSRLEADLYEGGGEEDYVALALDRRFDDGARLLVGRDIEDIEEREETLGEAAAWIIGSAAALGILGGILMSLAIGRRIEAVSATARRVIAGDLSGRIAVRDTGDDFDRLSVTLNTMLARIEESVEAVRRVSDSVAHELRTPLTRLRADLEDLSRPGASAEERDRLLVQVQAEAHRLQEVFDALFRIARIESGRPLFDPKDVDLSRVLEDAADLYLPAADERSISLVAQIAQGLVIRGDPNLIFQAACNLLDNAVKYSPDRGEVSLKAIADAGEAWVTFEDGGPGITAQHRERVTERFYRVPETSHEAGIGLGLSLVAAVTVMHKGSLRFHDVGPGLRVEWSFPASPHTVD